MKQITRKKTKYSFVRQIILSILFVFLCHCLISMSSYAAEDGSEFRYQPTTISLTVKTDKQISVQTIPKHINEDVKTQVFSQNGTIAFTFEEPDVYTYEIRSTDMQTNQALPIVYIVEAVVVNDEDRLNPYITITKTSDNMKYETLDFTEERTIPPETPPGGFNPNETKIITPKTGDDTHLWLWILIFATSSAMSVIGLLVIRKYRRDEKK